MKVGVDTHCGKLHELIQRPPLRLFDQAIHFKSPRSKINFGCAMGIEHGPFLGARLSGRNAVLTSRVRADYDFRIIDLFRRARLSVLIFGISKKIVEKTHGGKDWSLVLVLCSWLSVVRGQLSVVVCSQFVSGYGFQSITKT